MEAGSHWLVTAGLVTSSVIAIAANAFLLLIFSRRRGLRTVPNRFVINLLITNLLSSLLLVPLLIVDQSAVSFLGGNSTTPNETLEISHVVFQEEILRNTTDFEIIETSESLFSRVSYVNATTPILSERQILCHLAQASTSFVCTLSILSVLLISVNQYFGVIHSLHYHFYINKYRSTVFIIMAWLVAVLFALLSSVNNSDSPLWGLCGRRTISVFHTVYAVCYCFTMICVPFLAICIIYVCIYSAARKNSERMRKSTSTNLDGYKLEEERISSLPKVRSAPNFLTFDETPPNRKVTRTISERASNNFITSLKHKISSASLFKYREETRAAKVSVLVIFFVLFCYVPYGATLILNNTAVVDVRTSSTFNFNALVLLALSNVISPFLFGYRNKRVKREIGKIFGLVPPKMPDVSVLQRRRSSNDVHNTRPFLDDRGVVPEVVVTCKTESERKSILKRVYQSSNWTSYKKCNFMQVPDTCRVGEARGSFSSASTQTSNDDC